MDSKQHIENLADDAGEILQSAAKVKGPAFANAAAILFEVGSLADLVGVLAQGLATTIEVAGDLRKSIEHGVLLTVPTEEWDEIKNIVDQLLTRQRAAHARIAASVGGGA